MLIGWAYRSIGSIEIIRAEDAARRLTGRCRRGTGDIRIRTLIAELVLIIDADTLRRQRREA
jgi:hypothetical protein